MLGWIFQEHGFRWAVLAGLISAASPGQARLGETEPAIARRFGEPVATVPPPAALPAPLQARLTTRVYNVGGTKEGALVEVTLLDGTSVREFYFLEKEKSRKGENFNDPQVQVILEANAAGTAWESAGSSSWKRLDGAAIAERREVSPAVSLNPKIPLQAQLMVWIGLEVQSRSYGEFLASAQRERDTLRKQEEAEARKKREQEAAARDLLRGI
jgi:hypothetical protein